MKSVLNALPLYLLQALGPPLSVLKEREKIFARFFLGSSLEKKSIHSTIWKNLCLPLKEKGLNIMNLADIASAFGMKLWFKF